jgi:hypothetical protein
MSDEPARDGGRRVRASLGHGYVLLLFALTLIFAAAMLAMFNEPFDAVMTSAAAKSQTNASDTGITWINQAWTWAPIFAMLLALVMVIAAAVIQSGRRV